MENSGGHCPQWNCYCNLRTGEKTNQSKTGYIILTANHFRIHLLFCLYKIQSPIKIIKFILIISMIIKNSKSFESFPFIIAPYLFLKPKGTIAFSPSVLLSVSLSYIGFPDFFRLCLHGFICNLQCSFRDQIRVS